MHHHGHGHCGHHHGHHHGLGREENEKGLAAALVITVGIMVLEFVGGLVTNSLALLSDSGHMLSDAASLLLSLAAVWLASKPASSKRTYGFYRFEILAALVNGVTLVAIAAWIIWEAVGRFVNPPAVASRPMMAVAAVGLLANLVSAWVLMRKGDVKENVNVRSAYLHVLGDALGSVGAMAAGLVIWLFDWYAADPLISIAVAVLILKGAFAVVKQTVHILMEGTPAAIDHAEVKAALSGIDGVIEVHDLHIWTITSGLDSLSCHLLIEDGRDAQVILQRAIDLVETRFHIRHATIQIEMPHIRHGEMEV
ncbi:cation diffusion facilitator transporter family protein [Geobacillus kaustophilus]|uniref:Cation diffusion facilitator transporter family protein n=1 Tax=Geobacillus kaustophilus TaxID=1462 RepID=A0A0D8BSR7_GEOKU|nr:cation diffusion facilitator family transporter [Geobacillus kaustophilus]KJE27195.1 cation diffusion facilitator transporter family protein [Geobacillus kaustophilus]